MEIDCVLQVPLMLLQKMELLLSKTPDDQVRAHVLPLVYMALGSDTPKVQVRVLLRRISMINTPLLRNSALALSQPLASLSIEIQ